MRKIFRYAFFTLLTIGFCLPSAADEFDHGRDAINLMNAGRDHFRDAFKRNLGVPGERRPNESESQRLERENRARLELMQASGWDNSARQMQWEIERRERLDGFSGEYPPPPYPIWTGYGANENNWQWNNSGGSSNGNNWQRTNSAGASSGNNGQWTPSGSSSGNNWQPTGVVGSTNGNNWQSSNPTGASNVNNWQTAGQNNASDQVNDLSKWNGQ